MKFKVSYRVSVKTESVRDLLQEDDDPDSREHSRDHGGWEVVRNNPRPGEAEGELNQSREDDRYEEDIESAEVLDRGQDNDGESRGWTGDSEHRPTETSNDEPAYDPGDESGNERGPGGQRDPEAQRDCNQKNHQSGRDVRLQGCEKTRGMLHVFTDGCGL